MSGTMYKREDLAGMMDNMKDMMGEMGMGDEGMPEGMMPEGMLEGMAEGAEAAPEEEAAAETKSEL